MVPPIGWYLSQLLAQMVAVGLSATTKQISALSDDVTILVISS